MGIRGWGDAMVGARSGRAELREGGVPGGGGGWGNGGGASMKWGEGVRPEMQQVLRNNNIVS